MHAKRSRSPRELMETDEREFAKVKTLIRTWKSRDIIKDYSEVALFKDRILDTCDNEYIVNKVISFYIEKSKKKKTKKIPPGKRLL